MFFKGVILSLLVAKLRGGRLERLGNVKIENVWLALVALGIQVYIRTAGPRGWPSAELAPLLYSVSYLCLFVMIGHNRRLPGFWLIALGAALNFTALSMNGGRMPVSPQALAATGWALDSMDPAHNFSHQLADSSTILPCLGDIIPVNIPSLPRWLATPMPLSTGDLLQNAGAFWFVQVASGAGRRDKRPPVEEVTR